MKHNRFLLALVSISLLFSSLLISSVNAATNPAVTWKVSTLEPSSSYATATLATINSTGAKVWSVSGACTLKRGKVIVKVSGWCTVRLAVKATTKFAAKTFSKRFPITQNATSTTVNTSPVQSTTTTQTITTTTTTTVAPNVCTGSRCFNLGDTGPGGGTVFYVASTAFTSTGSSCATKCLYLEVAPQDWGNGGTTCGTKGLSTVDPRCAWSGNTDTSIGATAQGTAIGTGYSNTTAITTQSSGGGTANKAATSARAYAGGGKTDWFLPSKDELNELCKYARADSPSTTASWCGSNSAYLPTVRFSLAFGTYWSSSEANASSAWVEDFSNGIRINFTKNSTSYVRPVRAF